VTKISALRTVTTYRFLIVKSKKMVVFKDDINSTEDPEAMDYDCYLAHFDLVKQIMTRDIKATVLSSTKLAVC